MEATLQQSQHGRDYLKAASIAESQDTDEWRAHSLANMRRRNKALSHDEVTYLGYSGAFGLYKIGHTTNITTRLVPYRTHCPDFEILATYPHGREFERYLRCVLDDWKVEGEWYALGEQGADQVDAILPKFLRISQDQPEDATQNAA